MIEAGSRDSTEICAEMRKILNESRSIDEIQYVTLVDAETLRPVEKAAGMILAAVAVKMGTTRLIDNILLDVSRS
jgi:pantoate--beta-alanine ligase